MRSKDRPFLAGQIYEQIELLSSASSRQEPPSSDAHLISALQQVCTEDREIVAYVWEKLNTQAHTDLSGKEKQVPSGRQMQQGRGAASVRDFSRAHRPRRFRRRILELSAALLIVCALVVSMAVLLQRSHQLPGALGRTRLPLLATLSPEAIALTSVSQTLSTCNVSYPATLTPLSGPDSSAVFYLTGEGGYQTIPSNTSLVRYDPASGKTTVLIDTGSDSDILAAWLSPDKQWLLLQEGLLHVKKSVFQVIRTDGSLLQTVYRSCTAGSVGSWSPDGREIAFTDPTTSITVLDLASGRLQHFQLGSGLTSYRPAFWTDNRHVLVERNSPADSPQIEVELLDISKGTQQTARDVTPITSLPTFCGRIVSDGYGSQWFSSICTGVEANCQGRQVQGPSRVSMFPAAGGAARTIYSSPSRAVTAIAPAGPSVLLIYIENTSGDLSQDGLWKINTDGSGLARLTTTQVQVCQYDDERIYPFTQIASDGTGYALLSMDAGKQTLVVGSLAGGSPTTISAHQIANVNILLLVGVGIF